MVLKIWSADADAVFSIRICICVFEQNNGAAVSKVGEPMQMPCPPSASDRKAAFWKQTRKEIDSKSNAQCAAHQQSA